jgi:hypothetical protein
MGKIGILKNDAWEILKILKNAWEFYNFKLNIVKND